MRTVTHGKTLLMMTAMTAAPALAAEMPEYRLLLNGNETYTTEGFIEIDLGSGPVQVPSTFDRPFKNLDMVLINDTGDAFIVGTLDDTPGSSTEPDAAFYSQAGNTTGRPERLFGGDFDSSGAGIGPIGSAGVRENTRWNYLVGDTLYYQPGTPPSGSLAPLIRGTGLNTGSPTYSTYPAEPFPAFSLSDIQSTTTINSVDVIDLYDDGSTDFVVRGTLADSSNAEAVYFYNAGTDSFTRKFSEEALNDPTTKLFLGDPTTAGLAIEDGSGDVYQRDGLGGFTRMFGNGDTVNGVTLDYDPAIFFDRASGSRLSPDGDTYAFTAGISSGAGLPCKT